MPDIQRAAAAHKVASDMRTILKSLEEEYAIAIDMEFTIALKMLPGGEAQTQISVLQCRPQSHLVGGEAVFLPEEIEMSDLVIATEYMVPHGYVKGIEYVIYVPAEKYFALPSVELRRKVGHLIGRINQKMKSSSISASAQGVGERPIMIWACSWLTVILTRPAR